MRLREASLISAAGLAIAGAVALFGADAPAKPAPAPAAATPKAPSATYEKTIQPILQKYCYECHGNGESKADIALDAFKTSEDVDKKKNVWKLVSEMVLKHQMPPDDAKLQPTEIERDTITSWIENELYKYDPANPDPGRVVLHRLNRAEYRNTIRDLTGVDFRVNDDFPPDDSGYGFDNIGSVLSLPPMLMEKYLAAADKVLDQAIPTDPVPLRVQRYPAYLCEIGFNAVGVHPEDNWVELCSLEEDDVAIDVPIPTTGDYLVRFRAYAEPTGGAKVGGGNNANQQMTGEPQPQRVSIRVDDTIIERVFVTLDKDGVRAAEPGKLGDPGVYEVRVGLDKGLQHLRMAVDRLRGGANELYVLNGRVGRQQPGKIFVKWLEVEGPLPSSVRRFAGEKLDATPEVKLLPTGERELTTPGEVAVKFNVPKEGDYLLRAYAYAAQAGDEPVKMDLRVDGKSAQMLDVIAPARRQLIPGERIFSGHASALSLFRAFPERYEIKVRLTPGEKKFSAAFLNPFADWENRNPNLHQRALTIESLEVVGLSEPYIQPTMTDKMSTYFATQASAKDKAAAARAILAQFALRAWRRPPPASEVDRLVALYNLAASQGDSFEASIKLAMKAVLVSPRFLFRGEVPAANGPMVAEEGKPPAPASAKAAERASPGGAGATRLPTQFERPVVVKVAAASPAAPAATAPTQSLGVPVDEYTLASRLSYFLWSSTPDDELLDLAARNQLRKNLDAQVKRMVASPKSRALVDNFAGQWLQFRSLDTFEPDKDMFPDFSPELRTSMRKETEHFFDYILREDKSVMDFLTADYTFVNADLAHFYGLEGVAGEEFQKISLKDTPRRGILTQGSVLVLTSNPTRTSPVKRGKWVLDNLLGTPPPPPPPNVPVLEATELTGTLRQQMEQHRANPTCASCHARMDPIGFGFENFDAVGLWRDTDRQGPIDPSGQLVSGENFKGAVDLVQILAEKKRSEFLHCFAEKLLTYALGRGLEYYDRAATDKIVENLEKNGTRFSAGIAGVIDSVPFQQMRREEPAPAEPAAKPAPKLAAAQ